MILHIESSVLITDNWRNWQSSTELLQFYSFLQCFRWEKLILPKYQKFLRWVSDFSYVVWLCEHVRWISPGEETEMFCVVWWFDKNLQFSLKSPYKSCRTCFELVILDLIKHFCGFFLDPNGLAPYLLFTLVMWEFEPNTIIGPDV